MPQKMASPTLRRRGCRRCHPTDGSHLVFFFFCSTSGTVLTIEDGSSKSGEEAIMIRKVKQGYQVVSENGKKNLGGPYKTKAEAQKRLRQVEFFKHQKG